MPHELFVPKFDILCSRDGFWFQHGHFHITLTIISMKACGKFDCWMVRSDARSMSKTPTFQRATVRFVESLERMPAQRVANSRQNERITSCRIQYVTACCAVPCTAQVFVCGERRCPCRWYWHFTSVTVGKLCLCYKHDALWKCPVFHFLMHTRQNSGK
jgi:hypothetical protein